MVGDANAAAQYPISRSITSSSEAIWATILLKILLRYAPNATGSYTKTGQDE